MCTNLTIVILITFVVVVVVIVAKAATFPVLFSHVRMSVAGGVILLSAVL